MGIRLPPLKPSEEVDHVTIAQEHGHGVIAAAIHPSATHIRADIRAPANSLARSLVRTRHGDIPRRSPERISRVRARSGPMRIVILIPVLFVRLRNNAAGLLLQF